MPAKNTDSTTLICASDPGQCPTIERDSAHQAVGDAADAHQVGGQQEERHRQQDERVVGLEGFLREHHRRQPRLDQQDRQAGEPERKGDRHAQRSAGRRTRRTGPARPVRRTERCRSSRSLPNRMRDLVDDLLAREHDPGDAGHRPGDVDQPERQVGQLRRPVPGEPRELDARPHEHQRQRQHAEPRETIRTAASARRDRSGQTSTSKCVRLPTPTMAPIMIVQMNRKRAISSVQM